MKLIPLSRGLSAAVDDQDNARLLPFKWSAKPCQRGLYAVANIKGPDGGWHQQTMHRMLMNPPDDHEVVFKDFNGLNCQRSNLVVVTKAEARRHHHVRQDCKSGHKGLIYNEKAHTWSARINIKGRTEQLGTFYTWKEAADEYDKAARGHFGDVVPLHRPRPGETSAEKTMPTPVPPPDRPHRPKKRNPLAKRVASGVDETPALAKFLRVPTQRAHAE